MLHFGSYDKTIVKRSRTNNALNLYDLCIEIACVLLACVGLEDQLQQAKQHAEQFKSMSEANETALGDLNKVGKVKS